MTELGAKQIFAYFGGKQGVASKIVTMIPPHTHYIEMFAGGLAVFFRKPNATWSCVNDLNKDIANLYYCLSLPKVFAEVAWRLKWLVQSRELYDIADRMRQVEEFTIPNIERATHYLFYISNCFNQRIGTGFSDKSSNWNSGIAERLMESRKKLNNTIVENLDYVKLVDKHKDKENSFWYVDPPYWITGKVPYYKFNFTKENHKELKEQMDILDKAGAKFLISYDDIPEIRKLYKDYNVKPFMVRYGSNSVLKQELAISNYAFAEQETLELA
ncbi:MAG: DNA adenine methylase [Candidatus Brocadiales bacterium]|nr:DNA adenine methylase [Candidatus Brocadiales bacterium]